MRCDTFFARLKYLVVCFILMGNGWADAQSFGGAPASLKWRQINTDTVRVVFPQGQDSIAAQVASIVHWEQRSPDFSMGNKLRKINIVLQPQVTFSNGYVGLGPFRSEYYLLPPLNVFGLGAQSWAANLAIHEDRHVQQYNNFKVGLSKYVSWVFGEDGQALFNAAAVPNWYFEGDAVYNETRLSRQGRGRLPLFLNDFRALQLAGKNYSYMKWRNGSLRDYVPDHYSLGYLLVSYGYVKYGDGFWKKVTQDAAAFRHPVYPFQHALKKQAGISFEQFVGDAFQYYQRNWPVTADTAMLWKSPLAKRSVSNYLYPQSVGAKLFYLKNDYRQLPAFYSLENGVTNRIATASIVNDNYFATNGQSIIYASWRPDKRWGNKDYSEIRLLDLATKKERVLTHGTRLFTPDIDAANTRIVAAEIDEQQHSAVVLLDMRGNEIMRWQAAVGDIFTYPKFYQNSILYVARNPLGEMSLQQFSLTDSSMQTLVPYANHLIGFPNVHGDTLLYVLSANGSDGLYAYVFSKKQNYKVASYTTGIYQGSFVHDSLYVSAFTGNGYRLGIVPQKWERVNTQVDTLAKPYGMALGQKLDFQNVPQQYFPITAYSKLTKPFNFHSLQPDWDDPNYTLTLYGENILNTVQTNVFYNYNRNEKYSQAGASMVYGGWYVQPVIATTGTFQRSVSLNNTSDSLVHWNEYNAAAGLQLPLSFSGGKLYRYLTISSLFRYNQIYFTGFAQDMFRNYHFNYQDSRIAFSLNRQTAAKQIYPHGGFAVSTQFRNGYSAKALQWLTTGNAYLPGLTAEHSIVVNAAFAMRDTLRNYTFTNNFPFSRGYANYNYPRMWKLGLNYHLPLAYPDWGMAQLVYFLRIRANLFFDYTGTRSLALQRNYSFNSTGAELYFDTKWWNQDNVTFGLRYTRMMSYGFGNRWEIIWPINLFNN